jgi:hypothetical protein
MGILDDLKVRFRGVNTESSGTDPPVFEEALKVDPYSSYDEKALVDHVNKEYDRRLKERREFEARWTLNLAFYDSNQYVDINETTLSIDQIPPKYDWEQREVFNHIAPNIDTRIARLTKARPVLKARPGSNEPSDIRKTKVSSKLLQNIYSDQDLRSKLHNAITWLETCGTVIFKNYWDPTKGNVISLPQMGIDPVTGQEIQVGVEEQAEGDLGVMICSPQEILPDSCYHQDIKDCKRIMHQRAYSVEDIKEAWGKEVEPEENIASRLQRSMMGRGYYAPDGYSQGSNSMMKDFAIVKEEWERPSEKFPQGRLIVVANQTLLFYGPLPYKCDPGGTLGIPMTKVVCLLRPGVFWGDTVLRRLIPLQRRYNAVRNRKAEYLALCSIGTWVVEENSLANQGEFEEMVGQPGYIVYYRKGTGTLPHRAENQTLPPAFETEPAQILQEFSILSGVSEISRQSKAPSGVKSGVAMSLALEQDETRLSTVAGNIELALIEQGSMWLRFYKQYVKTPRLLRSVGRNNVVDVLEWTASDLKSEDVIIDSFSSLAETPAQRRQMVFDLQGAGLLIDPATGQLDRNMRNRALEMLEFFNWETMDDDSEVHVTRAERENRQMVEGAPATVMFYDDHVIHIAKHTLHACSAEFEGMVEQNPQLGQFFLEHIQGHQQALSQAAQQQQEAARRAQMTPNQTIRYEDLPPEAKVQLLAEVGITVTPEDIIEGMVLEAKMEKVKSQFNQPKEQPGAAAKKEEKPKPKAESKPEPKK